MWWMLAFLLVKGVGLSRRASMIRFGKDDVPGVQQPGAIRPRSSHRLSVCLCFLVLVLVFARYDTIDTIHSLVVLFYVRFLGGIALFAARPQNQEHLLVFAAGNTGWTTDRDTCTIDSPGIAKVHTGWVV